jgi:hypothetical protein
LVITLTNRLGKIKQPAARAALSPCEIEIRNTWQTRHHGGVDARRLQPIRFPE